jgi:hypothetical protein
VTIAAPPSVLGLTRWEFEGGAGILFRIWARPIVGRGGAEVVPVTLLWRHPDGCTGYRRCHGFVEAMEHAARAAAGTSGP